MLVLHRKALELLELGISKLVSEAFRALPSTILSMYFTLATNRKTSVNGDKACPVFVALWDGINKATDSPW